MRTSRIKPAVNRLVLLTTATIVAIGIGAARPTASAAQALPAAKGATSSRTAPNVPSTSRDPRALLNRYCVPCHNERLKVAGLTLDTLDPTTPAAAAATWEKVAVKLRAGAMPPAGQPRPDHDTAQAVAGAIEAALDREALTHVNPGRTPLHRLNRTEYANAIRDLLALEIDTRSLLPPDDTGYGFDNVADVLSVSPLLFERYLSAAAKIGRWALGDPTLKAGSQTYTVSKYERQDDRMGDDTPFASRGGLAVRHYFPLDGEYLVKVSLLRTYTDLIRGMSSPHTLQIRLDGAIVKEFVVGGRETIDGPASGGTRRSKTPAELNEQIRLGDARLETQFPTRAGTHRVSVTFLKRTSAPEGLLRPKFGVATYEYAGDTDVLPSVASIDVRGPFNGTRPKSTPSRDRLLLCHPTSTLDERRCATRIISTFARRAYRRPVTEDDIASLLRFFDLGRQDGDFDAGIQAVVEKVLVSPEFLFRLETDPAGAQAAQAFRISDLELASRLSFFLWSTIPDDELLAVAERGQLRLPSVLSAQVRRMLADAKAQAIVDNFFGQWLQVRNLRLASPDPIQFPDFDDNLRHAFQREVELFLASQLREDRRITDLLTADYTYINERLARHYGVRNVYGPHFRRVTLQDDARRGLLGKGALLTVTSYPNRTSPVLRGKWLLENILGTPPPPPPPNVPALADSPEGRVPASMRERMEQHRANPVCASCHRVMDPLGFALENFDAVGHWRATAGGTAPIDASGTLPDGTPFDGPIDLREALVAHRDQFVRTVGEKLLTYALGRGVDVATDGPAIRAILRASAKSEQRWSSLVLGIVTSQPFQMRRALGPGAAASIGQ